jgi:NADPH:quinone reductase-like Zn-dependent oxidoreductase
MQAVQLHSFGNSDVLKLEEVPKPAIGAGEVLVRVRAAGVNPIDWKVRAGYLQSFIPHQLPLILGWDVSGVVDKIGPNVTAFTAGQEVYGQLDITGNGAYAEYVVSRADRLGTKPKTLTHDQSAAVPVAAMAAWQALFGAGGLELKAGQTLLIHGAAGGVGTFAVQFAKWRGATVIGIASTANGDLLRGLGVDRVVDYRKQRFEDAVPKVDAVLDSIGGETQARSWGIIKSGGALASLVGDQWAGAPPSDIRKVSVFGAMAAPQLGEITKLIDADIVKPIISEVLPLSEAKRAHELIETGHTQGKIVLHVTDEDI